jgi:aminoglycoside phosphotransferase (APT) family kinase protein
MIDSIAVAPLAIDEGFTSSLYVATIRWGATKTPALAGSMPDKVVLKMLPQWSVGEQLTSAMQLQHAKEAWVIENWQNMGCRVPRGYYTATRGTAGDFIHVMEYMENTTAGDQLSSLPVDQAVAAVVEIAKMHAKFWGSHEPGQLVTGEDGHDDHARRRRPIPSGAFACDRWCFSGDSPHSHSNKLREAWIRMAAGVEDGVGPPGGWEYGFDGLANNKRVLAALAKKKGLKAVTTLEGLSVEMLPVLEHLLSPPQTLIHGDLRSANVMFPRPGHSTPPSSFPAGGSSIVAASLIAAADSAAGFATDPRLALPEASDGRPCIIDWGGLQRGKGVFDVAYLLGTGMSQSQRQIHQEKVLRKYHRALGEGGVDLTRYSWDQLMVDYEAALFLSAVLYAMPGVYDRGTTTEENAEAAKDVGLALGRNLQPVLDALGALNSDAHLQRHNRDTKSDAGGIGLFKHS